MSPPPPPPLIPAAIPDAIPAAIGDGEAGAVAISAAEFLQRVRPGARLGLASLYADRVYPPVPAAWAEFQTPDDFVLDGSDRVRVAVPLADHMPGRVLHGSGSGSGSGSSNSNDSEAPVVHYVLDAAELRAALPPDSRVQDPYSRPVPAADAFAFPPVGTLTVGTAEVL